MRSRLGNGIEAWLKAMEDEPPVSIRYNPLKPIPEQGDRVPWCSTGVHLSERPVFTLDPLFHAGAYYVQEASSMLVEQALRTTGLLGEDILAADLCAAPGGKSTLVRSLLTPGSLLVSNEVDGRRRQVLEENLWKWGWPGVLISGSPTRAFLDLPDRFDLVLVDAPCSGEGLMRRDHFAREQWSPELVQRCSAQQADILDHAWNTLAPGGALIYSTCTWEEAENEDQVRRLKDLGAEELRPVLRGDHGILQGEHGLRCYPHTTKGEGFFLAVLRKPGVRRPMTQDRTDTAPMDLELRGTVYEIPADWRSTVMAADGALRLTATSRPALQWDGSTPPHAGSAFLPPDHRPELPVLELDPATALSFLRGEALNMDAAKGIRLVTHEGFGLGWVRGAGRRWNNLYPKPWRIRMR